jgi:hypothetical protein
MTKQTCESCLQLSAANIKDLLKLTNHHGTLGCGSIGTMRVTKTENKLTLNYTCTINDHDPVSVREVIQLSAVKQPLGGVRWHMICPRCGRRGRILYMIGTRFMCRKCGNLQYATQGMSELEQAGHMLRKYQRQADLPTNDAAAGFEYEWHHPRYMHRSTFYRLRDKAAEYDYRYWMGVKRVLRL